MDYCYYIRKYGANSKNDASEGVLVILEDFAPEILSEKRRIEKCQYHMMQYL